MRFSLPGHIPVRVAPFFWVVAGLIGFLYSRSLWGTLIWMLIIFVSILVHEFGHAITAKGFGQRPRIELVPFGGLTYPEGPKIKLWKEFIVVFNGPLFGFSLFILASILLMMPAIAASKAAGILNAFRIVNLFWTIVNLLPVIPLDGGQLMRIIFESIFGMRGWKYALFTSLVIAVLFSFGFFILRQFLIGAIFFLFAFQNYDTWRRTRMISEPDRRDDLKEKMEQAEGLMQARQFDRAEPLLAEIRAESKQGMIFNYATQFLAAIKAEKGDLDSTYELLLSIKKHLSPESKVLLHNAAFHHQDYNIVIELSAEVFQLLPNPDIAVKTATAFAQKGEVRATIGWLGAAKKAGANLQTVTQDSRFDALRNNPSFRDLLQ